MNPACKSCEFRRSTVCLKAPMGSRATVHLIKECPIGLFGKTTFNKETKATSPINLAAVSCYFNPSNSKALHENYLFFLNAMKSHDIPLFVFELLWKGQKQVNPNAFIVAKADDANILWQKEQLLNTLAQRIPQRYNALAWLDADIIFFDKYWPKRTEETLQQFPVCQLWNKWHFSDGDGSIIQTGLSVGHLGNRFLLGTGHPGGAWAARREIFPLDITHILGGGDTVAVEAWLGMKNTFLQSLMNPEWKKEYEHWAAGAYSKVSGYLTTLNGEAVHLYHGTRDNRKYCDRSKWLAQYRFDPSTHITIRDGLLAWTDSAPEGLKQIVYDYFFKIRQEDDKCISSPTARIG